MPSVKVNPTPCNFRASALASDSALLAPLFKSPFPTCANRIVYTQIPKYYDLHNIFKGSSMQDNCVYARNLLGRLVSTYGSSASQTYSQAQTPSQDNFVTPGALMVIGAVLLMLFMSLRNRKKVPESKVQ